MLLPHAFDFTAPTAGQPLTVLLPADGLESLHVDGAVTSFDTAHLMGRDYALITTSAAQARVVASFAVS